MNIENLLKQIVGEGASDLFVIAGLPLACKVGGRQKRFDTPRLMPDDTEDCIRQIYRLSGRDEALMDKAGNHDDDFSFAISGLGRFRVNVFRQRGSLGAVVRIIPLVLPDPEAMHIPEAVLKCADLTKGLVLVTGPSGAGKTTTLACLIDRLNRARSGHIITMEDPIEFIHQHKKCIVTQREIPTDVASYTEALNSAMRESPDVLLLGEMRTSATIATAISAAEMTQLVFSTLHTIGAAGTIDRIIDAYPASQQHQARLQLSLTLQATISQQLVPTADGSGSVPAFEVMFCDSAIRNLIRDEKTHQIDSAIAAGAGIGMKTMDQSLFELCKDGTISKETALRHSFHHDALERRFGVEGI